MDSSTDTANTAIDTVIKLSGYRLTESLYQGAKTAVYRGVCLQNQQAVVIKLLQQDYPTVQELLQFRNQYEIAKTLDAPGITRLYRLEPYGNSYALIMEDMGGLSLRDYLTTHVLSIADVLAIALQLAAVLHYLYQHRIIHKDIKPANILIHPHSKQIKLIDFSIASQLPKETEDVKHPSVLEGTLAYLAPEQTGRMNRGVDYRSDFYALGITLFELLTGQLPFRSEDPLELVHCHMAKPVPSVCAINPDVPAVIGQIIGKLMAKNAEDRYQSALGLTADLETCLQQWKETGHIQPFTVAVQDRSDRFLIPETLYGREAEVQTLLDAFDRVTGQSTSPSTSLRAGHSTGLRAGHSASLRASHSTGLTANHSTGLTASPIPFGLAQGQPNPKSELMLVAGFSGIGKTAVVNEVHKPIVKQRGYCIKGKFDQFNRNIPFSAFVQAFRDLMGQLLSESDAQLQRWKTQILEAVGENGQVIIAVIPEVERIIGPQPPALELSGTAAQNRFNLLFQKFIQVFTTVDHPLVIFLDDLQWADSASLSLIHQLMTASQTGYLLLIGAYRDNEVDAIHPLVVMLEQVKKAEAIVNIITLGPLSPTSLNQLVAHTLQCSEGLAQPLTEIIAQKTQGNPFFATQYLKALHHDGLIGFNPQQGHWQCDIGLVRSAALTEDVVEFMAVQLQKLPAMTQSMLKLAACIGNQFDLATLAIVSEQSDIEAATALWPAIQDGLILPQSQLYKFYLGEEPVPAETHHCTSYRFLHDRIQQAAYSLIPDDTKQATHLKIGQLIWSSTASADLEDRVFEIVNHLNQGLHLIDQASLRFELAHLNRVAAHKAKAATAYPAAIAYLTVSLDLLPAQAWQTHYELMLDCHQAIAELTFLQGNFTAMQQWIDIVLHHSRSLLDHIKVYEVQIYAKMAQKQPLEAIRVGINALKLLDFSLPETPTEAEIQQAIAATTALLPTTGIASLRDLPTMTDANVLAAMRIAYTLGPASYMVGSPLFLLSALAEIRASIQYGNAPLSAAAYAHYGIVLCGMMDDIESGYQFGNLALHLAEQSGNSSLLAKIAIIAGALILPWKTHLKETLPLLHAGYHHGLESGSVDSAAFCRYHEAQSAYIMGQELSGLASQLALYSQQLRQIKQETHVSWAELLRQVILNLRGASPCPWQLVGEAIDENTVLAQYESTQNLMGLYNLHLHKLILCYWFNQNTEALSYAQVAATYLRGVTAQAVVPLLYFYDALVRLRLWSTLSKAEQAETLQQVAVNQEKLHQWTAHAAVNIQHKWELVDAERHRVLGNHSEAIAAYNRAIMAANTHGYIQEEALANELAAQFYLNCGRLNIAAGHMQDAYYGYSRWGAQAKVTDLETRYSYLLRPILQQSQTVTCIETLATLSPNTYSLHAASKQSSSSSDINTALDFAALLQVSQALSSTIQLDALVQTLTQTVLEQSGADRCALILCQDGEWYVRVITTSDHIALQSIPLSKNPAVPVKLIQYVKNTLETVNIDQLETILPGVIDDYLRQHQPKSVLCLPMLNQGQLVGILSLENQVTSGVFNRDRRLVLNFLCAQAAVSLENARLHKTLQQNEAKFRAFVEDANDLIYSVNPEAVFTYLSPQFQEMWGYEVKDFINQSFAPLVHPDDLPRVIAANQRVFRTGEKHANLEFRTQHKDGSWLWIVCNNSPIKDEQGHVIGLRGIARDITDRKHTEAAIQHKTQEVEQALQQLQQTQLQMVQIEKMSALGNLMAGVAHEINNPVGCIVGNINVVQDYIDDLFELIDLYQQTFPQPGTNITNTLASIDLDYLREDLPNLIRAMRDGGDRIKAMSRSLRNFSRADTDQKKPFNLHDGLDSTVLILRHRLKATNQRPEIKIMTQYGDIPKIACFPGQLNQVFMNILANAIDAFDECSQNQHHLPQQNRSYHIDIRTAVVDQQVQISIADNGVGMSETVKNKIFDHLFTTKEVGKGTGLGLAIARQIIVEKHGGAIAVNSTLGEGTEFVLTLPLS